MELPGALPSPSPRKTKNIYTAKNPLYFQKWNLLALILKKFLYFLKRKLFLFSWKQNIVLVTPSSKNKRNPFEESFLYFRKWKPPKTSYISGSNFLCLKTKLFYTFSYKEAKLSKLKSFFIIIIKPLFSFCNIFFCTQQAFVFHFLRDFCNIHDHIVAFFFFFFRKILMSFTSFFL